MKRLILTTLAALVLSTPCLADDYTDYIRLAIAQSQHSDIRMQVLIGMNIISSQGYSPYHTYLVGEFINVENSKQKKK